MSGVFGIIDNRPGARLDQALARMGSVMRHRGWYVVETYCDMNAGVGLGRIGIGILNKEPQPVISKDGNVVLFLAGEFFDWEGAPERSQDIHPDRFHNDAEYALHLYELYGQEFVRYLAGAFVIVIFDRSQEVVLIANDRFGLYPLYLEWLNGRLTFAPEVKGILAVSEKSPSLDEVALAQYIRFQQLLGTRTFFQNIQMLSPGSVLLLDLRIGQLQIETYWSFKQIPQQEKGVTFEEAAEEAARLMRLSVARRLKGKGRVGIYLSGGLDSRTILAACPPDGPRPITITFGLRNCRDVYYAIRVAKRARVEHHLFEFSDGNWVREYADFHLALTEGFQSWVHMHGIHTLGAARELFEINLTGLGGDLVLGGPNPAEEILLHTPDALAHLTHLFDLLNQKYCWPGISEAEEYTLYTPNVYAHLRGLAFESLRQEFQSYLSYKREHRVDFFGFQVDLRHYGHYVTFTRSHIEVRHPYYDYDLVDFLLGLPVHFRTGRRLQVAVLNRLNPSLAQIPTNHDEDLPVECTWLRSAHRFRVWAQRRFNRRIFPLFPERFPLHTDYERWLRYELREWAEAILLGSQTLSRGIFNPEALRSLWARLLSGQEEWMLGKIAPIMSYEMMLRKLCDASSV